MEKKAADVSKCQEKDQRCTGATPDLPRTFLLIYWEHPAFVYS